LLTHTINISVINYIFQYQLMCCFYLYSIIIFLFTYAANSYSKKPTNSDRREVEQNAQYEFKSSNFDSPTHSAMNVS
jgi:hypothetical protein